MVKTENMKRGKIEIDIINTIEYNTEGLDDEAIKILDKFDEIKFTSKGEFDKEKEKSIDEIYIVFGDLGYDLNIYSIDDSYYVEPLFINLGDKKYIGIKMDDATIKRDLLEDLISEFNNKWHEILMEDNVVKGKKVLITTDDGEVKSREFTINLNNEQLKELLSYFLDIIKDNEEFQEYLEQLIYYSDEKGLSEEDKNEIYDLMYSSFKEMLLESGELNLFYKAYIDIDGYVVKEDIKFNLSNSEVDKGELKSINFEMTIKYTNIEKEQNLGFDMPTEENTISIEEIKWEDIEWSY
jgi:hypothetical protein